MYGICIYNLYFIIMTHCLDNEEKHFWSRSISSHYSPCVFFVCVCVFPQFYRWTRGWTLSKVTQTSQNIHNNNIYKIRPLCGVYVCVRLSTLWSCYGLIFKFVVKFCFLFVYNVNLDFSLCLSLEYMMQMKSTLRKRDWSKIQCS